MRTRREARSTDTASGFIHLAAGSCVGLTGLAAGYTIGIIGDAGVRSFLEQPRIFVSMVLVLIFAEVGLAHDDDAHGKLTLTG